MEADPSLQLYDDFLARTSPDRLQKILARYELFKLASAVPGDIVECGVFKGSGLYTWAKLLRIFAPNNERHLVGFDFFGADRSEDYVYDVDRDCVDDHAAGWADTDDLMAGLERIGMSPERVHLVAGDIRTTAPRYCEENVGFRISLLHLDVDNYEGTKAVLEALYPRVTPGGVVVFDEYGYRGYGEADAVDEYFAGHGITLRTLPWANTPTAYVVKGGY